MNELDLPFGHQPTKPEKIGVGAAAISDRQEARHLVPEATQAFALLAHANELAHRDVEALRVQAGGERLDDELGAGAGQRANREHHARSFHVVDLAPYQVATGSGVTAGAAALPDFFFQSCRTRPNVCRFIATKTVTPIATNANKPTGP